jgi:NAD(P)-dependent dehydrogenase (short-subunit alcohol dehydrogenase family)
MTQTVIITGASRGLGAAIARQAAALGADLVLAARSEADLARVAADVRRIGRQALVVPGDLADPAACRALVDRAAGHFGAIDALVNNAGVLEPVGPIAEADPAGWERNLAVNLRAPMILTQAALPYLIARRGRVIHVSSGAAESAIAGWAAYCVAKAGLNHFSRVLATEEPEVTSIAVRPGVVDTEMQAVIRERGAAGMVAADHARFVRYHETGELLPPERPGRALAALALFAPAEWGGEFMRWDDERVQQLVAQAFTLR